MFLSCHIRIQSEFTFCNCSHFSKSVPRKILITILDNSKTVKRCSFDKFAVIKHFHCISKYYIIKYFWFLKEDTINNFLFEIILYFFQNGNNWKRGWTLGDRKLKFSRRDLQIFGSVLWQKLACAICFIWENYSMSALFF